MSNHKAHRPNTIAVIVAGVFALSSLAFADESSEIKLPGDSAYPESIATASDGTLYVSSLASGGIWRIKPGTAKAEEWIKPGAFDTRSTFGVLVDPKANLLWVCSNDVSGLGVPGPSSTKGSYVKGFDLASGEGKVSVALPGKATLCNDMAIGADGSLFVTNSLAPQIMRLKPGSTQLEVWVESPAFEQPAQGAGLDGIAFRGDGNIYVNTFTNGAFFRVEVKDGSPGKVTKLQTSRPLRFPDGL
jgi:streptogramin lyase